MGVDPFWHDWMESHDIFAEEFKLHRIVENLLRFSFGNAKLPATTAIFDIPAGYTCPGAHLCQSRFDRGLGR